VTNHRIRLEGPAALTLSVVTALADADGVELIASDQPVPAQASGVALDITVEGAFDAVADAVASIRAGTSSEVSIEIVAR
jgi:hypothetical protein